MRNLHELLRPARLLLVGCYLAVGVALAVEQGIGVEVWTSLAALPAFLLRGWLAYAGATAATLFSWFELEILCDFRYAGPTRVLCLSHDVHQYLLISATSLFLLTFYIWIVEKIGECWSNWQTSRLG